MDVHRPLDSGRLAGQRQDDGEPRLPLGLQQPGKRSPGPPELHLRSDDSEPDLGEGWSTSAWRVDVREYERNAEYAVQVRQEQLPGPRRARVSNQREDC